MYSQDRETGRPNNLSAKNWQMMQSNFAKERTHQLGWNETAKAIKVWAEKEDDDSL